MLVATKPVDFRKGVHDCAALVKEQLKGDLPSWARSDVFRAKRADRVKLMWWDGSGLCLLAKRLEDGKSRWPRIEGWCHSSDGGTAAGLGRGLDGRRVHTVDRARVPR